MIKRMLDIVVAITLLIVLFPIGAIITCLIKWQLGNPIFFVQKRPGLKGEPFYLYKFRTMSHITDADGELLEDAKRLTTFGRLLRNTSLDELPQLWNVVRGELSIVGPRPLLMEYLPLYSTEQMRRHDVKPGITGWAQVNGRNQLTWEEKFDFDLWYVDHASFWLDLKIIGMTLLKVIKRDGINQSSNLPMERFQGMKSSSGDVG